MGECQLWWSTSYMLNLKSLLLTLDNSLARNFFIGNTLLAWKPLKTVLVTENGSNYHEWHHVLILRAGWMIVLSLSELTLRMSFNIITQSVATVLFNDWQRSQNFMMRPWMRWSLILHWQMLNLHGSFWLKNKRSDFDREISSIICNQPHDRTPG